MKGEPERPCDTCEYDEEVYSIECADCTEFIDWWSAWLEYAMKVILEED